MIVRVRVELILNGLPMFVVFLGESKRIQQVPQRRVTLEGVPSISVVRVPNLFNPTLSAFMKMTCRLIKFIEDDFFF